VSIVKTGWIMDSKTMPRRESVLFVLIFLEGGVSLEMKVAVDPSRVTILGSA